MSEELAVQAVRAAFGASGVAPMMNVAEASPQVAEASQVAAFEAAMRGSGVASAPQVAVVPPAAGEAMPFVDRVSDAFVNSQLTAQEITARLAGLAEKSQRGGMMSAGELLELQRETAYLKFHLDLVSKVVDRASQAVQTLVKNS